MNSDPVGKLRDAEVHVRRARNALEEGNERNMRINLRFARELILDALRNSLRRERA